jgi:antitoxin (DNA-binding transcriptional repressor) of toxin-antitoxin stability system
VKTGGDIYELILWLLNISAQRWRTGCSALPDTRGGAAIRYRQRQRLNGENGEGGSSISRAEKSDAKEPRSRLDEVATSSYHNIMRSVGIKLLKNKLSEYIRLAAGGETVLVTDRDRVVAELGPPAPGRSPLVSDALLLEAVRQGWIRPPLSLGKELPARKPVMRLSEILQDLQQDRADR